MQTELENKTKRTVADFDQDEEGHWRARLDCGHAIHVRHDPPWTVREWVLKPEERARRVGTSMDCKRCDEEGSGEASSES